MAAVMPVHVGGRACAMEAITSIAKHHGVPVVEDSAHAFPVVHHGRMLGTWGDVGVYSLYATKAITTGEGGVVVTRRDDIARRIRVMRLHGIDRDVWNRYTAANASWQYDVVEAGYKYNLTDLASAIGLAAAREGGSVSRSSPGRGPRVPRGPGRVRLPRAARGRPETTAGTCSSCACAPGGFRSTVTGSSASCSSGESAPPCISSRCTS